MTRIQNLNLYLGISQIPKEERKKCIPTVIRIIELCKFVAKNGIIALQDQVINETGFLKTAITITSEIYDYDICEKILHNSILSSGDTGVDLLNKIIIADGLILLLTKTESCTPYILANVLGSFNLYGCLSYFSCFYRL